MKLKRYEKGLFSRQLITLKNICGERRLHTAIDRYLRVQNKLRLCSHDAGTKKCRLISSPFCIVYTILVKFKLWPSKEDKITKIIYQN